jgi:hypothetical protein
MISVWTLLNRIRFAVVAPSFEWQSKLWRSATASGTGIASNMCEQVTALACWPFGRHHRSHVVRRQTLCDQVVTARLDRQALAAFRPSVLRRLPNVSSLHLQHNRLKELLPLRTFVTALRFLSLAHNELVSFAGLESLEQLMTLDVAHNNVCELDPQQFPPSLRFLKVRPAHARRIFRWVVSPSSDVRALHRHATPWRDNTRSAMSRSRSPRRLPELS